MAPLTLLTSHAQALLCIARDPTLRLRDIATSLGVTERTAYGLVTDLALAGYLVRTRIGRRSRYSIQAHEVMLEARRERTIGEVLEFLNG